MKLSIKLLAFATFFILNNSCSAQPIMRTVADAQKIKANENLFIEKPLKLLLKEIGPKIKLVSANPSNNTQVRLGYLTFRFVDMKSYDSSRATNKYPVQITVFVKEPFKWDIKTRLEKGKGGWTKDDEETYGDLTVVGLRVFGKN
jgi:hypothetical protein